MASFELSIETYEVFDVDLYQPTYKWIGLEVRDCVVVSGLCGRVPRCMLRIDVTCARELCMYRIVEMRSYELNNLHVKNVFMLYHVYVIFDIYVMLD